MQLRGVLERQFCKQLEQLHVPQLFSYCIPDASLATQVRY